MKNKIEHGIFNDLRLNLFKEVQNGNLESVESILKNNPALINSKTTTKGSSLLHIASERGHISICHFLLNHNHETNPVNHDGKTPYQLATKLEITQILVQNHLNSLCNKYYQSVQDNKNSHRILPCEVMSKKDFLSFMNSQGIMSNCTRIFGVTILGNEKPLSTIQSFFREDILMTPCYGELLVIHENEQALQFIDFMEYFRKNNTPKKQQKQILNSTLNQMETRAFLKFVSKGLELFPFLNEYPQKNDRKDIVLVKKMFIAFGLLGLAQFHQECTPDEFSMLEQLEFYKPAIEHTNKIICRNNSEKNLNIVEEMNEQFTQYDCPIQPQVNK